MVVARMDAPLPLVQKRKDVVVRHQSLVVVQMVSRLPLESSLMAVRMKLLLSQEVSMFYLKGCIKELSFSHFCCLSMPIFIIQPSL